MNRTTPLEIVAAVLFVTGLAALGVALLLGGWL